MSYQYTYHEHKYYKYLFQGLESYIDEMEYGEDVHNEGAVWTFTYRLSDKK